MEGKGDGPRERISHLEDFMDRSWGKRSLSSSNRSFISLRRFLSASLWLTLSSGDLE